MRVDAAAWEHISHRLSTGRGTPPIAVHLLILTLLNGAELKDSYAEMETTPNLTTWRNWVITDKLIAYTEVTYPAANYESTAEDAAGKGNGLEPTVLHAWIRPLSGAASLHIGAAGRITGPRLDWYPVDGLTLIFGDGSEVPLPDQSPTSHHERERSDRFLASVRARIGF